MNVWDAFVGGLGAVLGPGGVLMLPVAAIVGAGLIGFPPRRFAVALASAVLTFPAAALLHEPWYQPVTATALAPRFVLPSLVLLLLAANLWRMSARAQPSLVMAVVIGAIVGGIWARLWPGTPGPVLSVTLGSFGGSVEGASLWVYAQALGLVMGLVAAVKWLAWRRSWLKPGQRAGAVGMFFLGLLVLSGAYHWLVLRVHAMWPWSNWG